MPFPRLATNNMNKLVFVIETVVFRGVGTGMLLLFESSNVFIGRSQWPRGLSRRSSAARLLRSWVRIPPRAWMFVCCECCVLSGRSLCDVLITRPEESFRLWCVVVWSRITNLVNEEAKAHYGAIATKKNLYINSCFPMHMRCPIWLFFAVL